MLMLSLVRTLAVAIPWMLNLAIWLLARSPPTAGTAGARHRRFRVRAGAGGREQVGKALCPKRLLRQLRSCFR